MTTTTNVEIKRLNQVEITLRMVGTTPLYFNSMSAKTKRDLLIGGGRKTAAEKKQIKHNPEQEFRDSLYKKSYGETLLCFPAPGIKQAMATAALETDGIKKTTVNRLLFLPEQYVNVWGTPYLKMDIVRSADMNRTPDVRTRGYLPRWCAEVRLRFVTPALKRRVLLLALEITGKRRVVDLLVALMCLMVRIRTFQSGRTLLRKVARHNSTRWIILCW